MPPETATFELCVQQFLKGNMYALPYTDYLHKFDGFILSDLYSVRQTSQHILNRPNNNISTAFLIDSNFIVADEHDRQDIGIAGLFDGAVVENNVVVVGGVANVEAAASVDSLERELQGTGIGLGCLIGGDNDIPPVATTVGSHTFQCAIYFRANTTSNQTEVMNTSVT